MDSIQFVRKQTPEFERHWNYVYDLRREMADEWDKVFRSYVDELQEDATLNASASAVELNAPQILVNRLPWLSAETAAVAGFLGLVRQAMERAGKAEALRLKLGFRFDLDNPFARRWAEQHAAELVTQVSTETKQAIRTIITDAFDQGTPARAAGRQIRRLIGLTTRDAKAVMNYWRTLSQESDLSARRVDELADTYARRLLRRRAESIARTEIVTSANAGQQSLYLEANNRGLLLPETKREWIAAVDSPRTCRRCLSLDGQRVGLTEPFYSDIAGTVYHPALHVNCRCAIALITEVNS